MKSIHALLDEVERTWRSEVREHFPLRADMPVIRRTEPNERDWTFSTDLRRIFAHIANDEALQRKFKDVVAKYWTGTPEELVRHTLKYLLFHELYHPLEAPRSVEGDDNDNKCIHQAIRRGALQAEPQLSALEQIIKVQASQYGVKDFILDNRFYIDNLARGHVRQDIIPTWDVLELHESPAKTNFYTVTRLLYGLLYGPQSTHAFFEEKAGKDGHNVGEKALAALVREQTPLPRAKNSLLGKAKSLVSGEEPLDYSRIHDYIEAIREVFAGEDRYQGIERFMAVLGPYIEKDMPQGRPDMQGEGSGTSPQNILQDLLDDMSPQEQQEFMIQLAQEDQSMLDNAANQMKPKDKPSSTSSQTNSNEMRSLDLLATHEYYKRMHPKVVIHGSSKIGESVVVGKQEYWHLKNTTVISQEQLARLNLSRINQLQRRTRLPWLMDLGNGTFRLNEYDLRSRDIKDIVYADAHIDVPDVVEFYVDSSGSMFGGSAGVFAPDDGSRWDMLSHVLYGFADALLQGGQKLGKQTKVRIHNFANTQVASTVIPLEQFWRGDIETLKVLFKPENGYGYEDISLAKYNDGQRRAYVVVTDGNLVLEGRTAREAKKMKELAKNPNNSVVLFEIGGTYALGNAVKDNPDIVYRPVHDKHAMLEAGLEVLLAK